MRVSLCTRTHMYFNRKYVQRKFKKMLRQNFMYKFNHCPVILSKSIIAPARVHLQKFPKEKASDIRTRSQLLADQVSEFLKKTNQEHFIDIIPKKLLQNYCNQNSLVYLVDPSTANDLSLIISQELLKKPHFIVECNPGLGLLTQELLNIGVSHIMLLENCDNFINPSSPLHALISKHNERISLKQISFQYFCHLMMKNKYSDKVNADNSISYLDYKRVAYIVPFINKASMSLIIYNFCNQTILFDGQLTFFLIVSSAIWQRLNIVNENKCKKIGKDYNRIYVILSLFFNIKFLGNVRRKAFLPWPHFDQKEYNVNNSNYLMSIVKLEPIAKYPILKTDLRDFWHFLRYCLRTNAARVIVELEKLVPGCGIRLIVHNIHICTRFKDLDPDELLNLFKEFRSWPEYSELFRRQFYKGDRKEYFEEMLIDDSSHDTLDDTTNEVISER